MMISCDSNTGEGYLVYVRKFHERRWIVFGDTICDPFIKHVGKGMFMGQKERIGNVIKIRKTKFVNPKIGKMSELYHCFYVAEGKATCLNDKQLKVAINESRKVKGGRVLSPNEWTPFGYEGKEMHNMFRLLKVSDAEFKYLKDAVKRR